MVKVGNNGAFTITMQPQLFNDYLMPKGWLVNEMGCHGLFFYYLRARNNFEQETGGIILEGENDPKYNYRQLFTSTSLCYGISPDNMVNYWHNIDMQCDKLNLPRLPDLEKYRMNRTVVVRSH